MTKLNLDYEVRSEIDLLKQGLDVYSAHPSTQIILAAYSFDDDQKPKLWDYHDGNRFPAEVKEALEDPEVEKRAFNAQFERVISRRVGKIKTPYTGWRCTMAQAYLLSFSGGLGDVGKQMGLSVDKQKSAEGLKLIRRFCMPQKLTKNQPHLWRDALTDPDLWEIFREYCRQDVLAELSVEKRLRPFYIPDDEWTLYELDQKINDRGLPLDYQYIDNAIWMAAQRKKELLIELNEITGLRNSNSSAQMLPWLKARGYPFDDLQKDTVKKVLKENKDDLDPIVVNSLNIRRNATRTSVAKYTAMRTAGGKDGRFRFSFQFAGATRTARWGGRRVQPQNLPRTPKLIEKIGKLAFTSELIRRGDYDGLALMLGEQMEGLVGCIRSAIRADEGRDLRVSDLASIETCVIAWLADCVRLLRVIRSGKDAYRDFAIILYQGIYAEFGSDEYEAAYARVTSTERGNSKPAVLGAGYRLGGGDLKEGKRTGLWGYAENMGIDLLKEESHAAVAAYRETYEEIPALWKTLEKAVARCLSTGREQRVSYVSFELKKPFLAVRLPSGRYLYYYKPLMQEKAFVNAKGETYTKMNFTYMGQDQVSKKWVRMYSHGGKLVENLVQAIARDILKYGMFAADDEGFKIVGTVHDEIITEHSEDDEVHTSELLGDCMTRPLAWAPNLPLGAAGWRGPFYRKD